MGEFDKPIREDFTSYIDIISEVVANIDVSGISGVDSVTFIYGDEEYIVNKLTEWSRSSTKRATTYPLIALLNDFEEDKDDRVKVSLVVCNSTNKAYDNDQRKNNNFIPVLNPIYDGFLKSLRGHPRVCGQYKYDHKKFDLYSIGRKPLFLKKTVSTEYVDAIRIQQLELKFIKD